MGVAWPPAGSSNAQSSLPVSESNARSRPSMAAAVKTRPPAVTMGPPRFGVPVGTPGTMLPSGTSHRMAPVNRSTAATVPHGGALHGCPPGASSGARTMP